MTDISTLRKSPGASDAPSGDDALHIRERYLRRRSHRRRLGDRGLMAIWVGVGALLSWIFVVGFTALLIYQERRDASLEYATRSQRRQMLRAGLYRCTLFTLFLM